MMQKAASCAIMHAVVSGDRRMSPMEVIDYIAGRNS